MLRIAGFSAGSIGLKFFVDTHRWRGVLQAQKNSNNFFQFFFHGLCWKNIFCKLSQLKKATKVKQQMNAVKYFKDHHQRRPWRLVSRTLNSLFKVLFKFPSLYLFAIGLGVIFSLTRSLNCQFSCNTLYCGTYFVELNQIITTFQN